MKICSSYLHCSHGDFLKLPLQEKEKWILFERLERERENHFLKKEQDAIAAARNKTKNKYNMQKG